MGFVNPQSSTVIFGFDSAWTDAPKAPGAICALAFDEQGQFAFHEPRLVSFSEALVFIDSLRRGFDLSLVALDQPTIVPNAGGSRPVDKVAASLVSFVGGGVQPANRSKIGMFCDNAPIWPFVSSLNANMDPVASRNARSGHFLIEVFPALALPSLKHAFSQRLQAPKYNPQNRRKFRLFDWLSVLRVIQEAAEDYSLRSFSDWANQMSIITQPRKADQDRLDAALCALIGLNWRAGPLNSSAILGDLHSGYMVTPISDATRSRLVQAATRHGVPISSDTQA